MTRCVAQVAQRLAALLAAGPCAVSADAVDEGHLDALAAALVARWAETAGGTLVAVGSAGLARALAAQALPTPRDVPLPPAWTVPGSPAPASAARPPRGPVLVVAGSRTAVTAGQLAHLLAQPDVAGLRLDLRALDAEDWERRAPGWVDEALQTLIRATAAGARTLVVQPAPGAGAGAPGQAESLAHFARRSARLNAALGALVQRAVAAWAPAGLVLTGGDIARAVLAALGAERLQLGPEVLPGLPLGWPVDGACAGLPLVTKAGGFGGPEALAVAVRVLQAGARA